MLGEMSEAQKGKYCMIHFDKMSRMGKLMEKEKRLPGTGESGEWEGIVQWIQSVYFDEKVWK